MISIKTLKKDFPELNKFKDKDLKMPIGCFPVNNSYHIVRMISNSGYIKDKYDGIFPAPGRVYYNGTDFQGLCGDFRIADFIAAYELKKKNDNSYCLMDEPNIGPIITTQIFNYLRSLSDGLYDPEPNVPVEERNLKQKRVATLHRIKAVSRAAMGYGMSLDEVLSAVKEVYGGKEE